VRYYGLYVPGASAKRDLIREQLNETLGETVKPTEKPKKTCPVCGAVLFHYRSTRRKISYIRYTRPPEGSGGIVQQAVEDRPRLAWEVALSRSGEYFWVWRAAA